jgi:PII-like signaling protein
MNQAGLKLTTYFSERQRSGSRFLADALFDLYEQHRMRTSVLLRGAAGFGQHHHLHTDRLLTLSEALPAVSIAIDSRDKIERAVDDVTRVVDHGLITLERAQIITEADLDRSQAGGASGSEIKLTLYGGRSVRADGQTGYVAALELLRRTGAAGASVLLGVDGTLHGQRRRARFFARNADVPLMLFAVGDEERMAAALPRLAALLDEPVATIERIQICKSAGALRSEPRSVPAEDPSGLPINVKLMIHTEEQSKYGGHPLYVELVRRLRAAGVDGATVLRGARGFYGDRGPFADRMFSLRRNVPVHVVVVGRPTAIERWWPIVDQVTREDGLVTCELVPAAHVFSRGAERRLQLASTPTARES